jgi:hypothetical protein
MHRLGALGTGLRSSVNEHDRSTPRTDQREALACTARPEPSTVGFMPSGRRPKKVPLYFRVSPEAAARVRQFLADYAGKPLFIKPGEWAEAVLLRAIDEVEENPPETPKVNLANLPRTTHAVGQVATRRLNHATRRLT